MNGYYFHIGDYYRDTVGLSTLEHGIYRQLLDRYYEKEQNLPCDLKELRALLAPLPFVRNQLIHEILQRFFVLCNDGWHHKRADKALQDFANGAPARAARKEAQKIRKQRHDGIKRIYYDALRMAGCPVKWQVSIQNMRDLAQRMGINQGIEANVRNAIPGGMGNVKGMPLPQQPGLSKSDVAESIRHGMRNDLPTANSHIKDAFHALPHSSSSVADGPAADVCVSSESNEIQTAATVADAAKRLGIAYSNPTDFALLSLLRDGAAVPEFENAFAQASAMGKGWAYALGIVKNRRSDAAKKAQEGPKSGQEGGSAVPPMVTPLATPLKPFQTAELAKDPEAVRALLAPLRASLTRH